MILKFFPFSRQLLRNDKSRRRGGGGEGRGEHPNDEKKKPVDYEVRE